MRAELETYARELGWILGEVGAALEGLTERQLNWRPSTGEANSTYAIASHVAGCTRVYALGFGCGQPVERDRPAEFAATAPEAASLIGSLRQLPEKIKAALGALSPAALDRRSRPPRELWGTGEPQEISGREALVESIRHAALHLGELRLTRDLARRHA